MEVLLKCYVLMSIYGEQYEQTNTSVLWVGTRKPTHCELRLVLNYNILVKDVNRVIGGESYFYWAGRDGISVWIEEYELNGS